MDWYGVFDVVPDDLVVRWRSGFVEYERAEAGRADAPQNQDTARVAAVAGHDMVQVCRDLAGQCVGLPAWVLVTVRITERYFEDRAAYLDLVADVLAAIPAGWWDPSWLRPWTWPSQLYRQARRLHRLRRRHRHWLHTRGDTSLDLEPAPGPMLAWDPTPDQVSTLWTAAWAEYERTGHEHRDTPQDRETARAAATAGHRLAEACGTLHHTTGDGLPSWLQQALRIAEHDLRERATHLGKHADQLALDTLSPWPWQQHRRNRA